MTIYKVEKVILQNTIENMVQNNILVEEMIRKKRVQIYLLLDQAGVWGPPTMQFGGIWRYFSTFRLKIDRPNDNWSGLWLSL